MLLNYNFSVEGGFQIKEIFSFIVYASELLGETWFLWNVSDNIFIIAVCLLKAGMV
jgi:hypothetical protein